METTDADVTKENGYNAESVKRDENKAQAGRVQWNASRSFRRSLSRLSSVG